MRYHWGLGVGHYHAHQAAAKQPENSQDQAQDANLQDSVMESAEPQAEGNSQTANTVFPNNHPGTNDSQNSSDASDSDDGELGLDDRQQEGWEDVESELDSEAEKWLGDDAEDEIEDHTGM